MKFFVTSSLYYEIQGPATILCSLSCIQSSGQNVIEEILWAHPYAQTTKISLGLDANRFTKLEFETTGEFQIKYESTVNTSFQIKQIDSILEQYREDLDPFAIPYLFPSRYAPSDRMRYIANDLFGGIKGHLAQAIAIEDWLFENLCYTPGVSNEQSWSLDTFETRTGVCRDFAHLGIALCRALSIPARYVTVYAFQLYPEDFHAIFEVYVGGTWFPFDGTRKAPLNGMVRIAIGKDASEAPVATLFGDIVGQGMCVNTLISKDEKTFFEPITREFLRKRNSILSIPP